MNPAVDRLLYSATNPVVRAAFLDAVRSREPINALNLPDELIVPALLLATLAREYGEPAVVDDLGYLMERARDNFNATVPIYHIDNYIASCLVFMDAALRGLPEAEYVGNAYKELTGTFVDPDEGKLHPKKRGKKGNNL